jgi:DNA-binding transcriptional regulator YiaG
LISAGSALPLGKTGNAGRGEVLDRHSLKEALQVLGLTLEEFSMLANTSLDTVKKWSSGKTKTPGIALAMVRLLAQMR